MTQTYRLLDLDNCVADDAWRIPRINWGKTGNPRYEEYHLLCGFDSFVNRSLTVTDEKLIIMTGRPCLVRGITEEWLRRHNIHFHALIMRNNDDARRSVEVKEGQLNWLEMYHDINIKWQISSAFDDHLDIVKMYQSYGIKAEVRTAHNVSAYINPTTKELAR